MSDPRKAIANLKFNGKNTKRKLLEYLETITYTDVASGASDQLDLELENINMEWITKWYPHKGDNVEGVITLKNWEKVGNDKTISCGSFTLDSIKFSGGPLKAQFGCVSAPAEKSFSTRERTKPWKDVSMHSVVREIAERYGLGYYYHGPDLKIEYIEQSEKTDSAFLTEICEKYGLSLKIYRSKIVVYDQTEMESKEAVAVIEQKGFIDGKWDYNDELAGTYTGARISYKGEKDEKEISVYLGLKPENEADGRILKINETADNIADAYYKAAAKVNTSNQEATTLSGDIWPNPKICAGATVKITGLGVIDGKYFVDKSTIKIGDSGTKQSIDMHKCQNRLTYGPRNMITISSDPEKTKTVKATKANGASTGKEYKTGDIVDFKGGMCYASSYPGASGQNATAGKAKITMDKNCAGNGKAHPYHIVSTDGQSNVYGWVDEGTFS